MKGGVVIKLRLIVFLPSILVLWDDKGTLAVSVPQMHDNSQFPKFLVLDKPGGKKSLIEIEGKTGRKESVQKQTEEPTDALRQIEIDHDCYDCGFAGQICCNFGNGTRRCDYAKNCPHLGKENGIKRRCKNHGEKCGLHYMIFYGKCCEGSVCEGPDGALGGIKKCVKGRRITRCLDCGHTPGMICCKFGNGTEDCTYEKNCPTYVDKSAISKEDPCAGLSCGKPCNSPCPPGKMCPIAMRYCQADGSCGMNKRPECGKIDQKKAASESRSCQAYGDSCVTNSECCSQCCKTNDVVPTCGTWTDC